MTAYTLNEAQRQKAQELLDGVQSRDITEPQDIISSWGEKLSWSALNQRVDYGIFDDGIEDASVEKRVPTAEIVGVLGPGNGDRLEKSRMEEQLQRLLNDEFDPDHPDHPVYVEFDGSFYVTADGIHRSLSCRAVGVEYITGEVDIVR